MNISALPAALRALVDQSEAVARADIKRIADDACDKLDAIAEPPQDLLAAITTKAKATAAREKLGISYAAAVVTEREAGIVVSNLDDAYQRERLRLACLAHPAHQLDTARERIDEASERFRQLARVDNALSRACTNAILALREHGQRMNSAADGIGSPIHDLDAFVTDALAEAQRVFDGTAQSERAPIRNRAFYESAR